LELDQWATTNRSSHKMKEEEACNQMVGLFPWLASVCAARTLHLLFYTPVARDEN